MMKKLTKSIVVSALIAGALGLASMTSAMPFGEDSGCGRSDQRMGWGHKRGNRGFNLDRMAKKLDLTDDQQSQIEAITADAKSQMNDLRQEMQANRKALRELTQQSLLDEAEVRNVADTQGDLKADMIVLRAQRHAKIAAILTEDQRAQLEEMRGKRRHYR